MVRHPQLSKQTSTLSPLPNRADFPTRSERGIPHSCPRAQPLSQPKRPSPTHHPADGEAEVLLDGELLHVLGDGGVVDEEAGRGAHHARPGRLPAVHVQHGRVGGGVPRVRRHVLLHHVPRGAERVARPQLPEQTRSAGCHCIGGQVR